MDKICPKCGETITHLIIHGYYIKTGACSGEQNEFDDEWDDLDDGDYEYEQQSLSCPECYEEIDGCFDDLKDYKEKALDKNIEKLLKKYEF